MARPSVPRRPRPLSAPPRLRRLDRLKLGLALCSRPKNHPPDEMHDFLNEVLSIAGDFKLTVCFLFAGDVLTAFDEINCDMLA